MEGYNNNQRRLLLISGDFNLEKGGIQNTSYLLAKYISKDLEVTTFCRSDGDSPILPGIRNKKSRYKESLFYFLSVFEIIPLYRKFHFDYALATNYYDGMCLFFLNFFCGLPYGVMTHGNEVVLHNDRGKLKKIIFFLTPSVLRRYLTLKRARHVFCNTEFTASYVRRILPNADIHIIHPPISMMPNKDSNDAKTKSGYVLSINRLVERKGCQYVVQAMAEIVKTLPNLKYIIVGEGEYEGELHKLVSNLQLDNSIIFKGRVSEEVKLELLKKCDLFIMPSIYIPNKGSVEGFGLSFLEANSFGKFVIGTKSGGIPEAIIDGKTGCLIAEKDIQALVDSILHFYDNGFSYDPQECKEWAKRHHISNICKEYVKVICET